LSFWWFVGWSGDPSTAALSINPRIDTLGHERAICRLRCLPKSPATQQWQFLAGGADLVAAAARWRRRLIVIRPALTLIVRVADSSDPAGKTTRLHMARASAAQPVLPFVDLPRERPAWDKILCGAFADSARVSGFLTQAEEAVRARSDDGVILLLAATAALLDQNPERAQVFLKRFAKHYRANGPYHLLHALALAQEGRSGAARSELKAYELGDRFEALQNFPGGWTRRGWLFREHDRIFGRDKAARSKRKAADAGPAAVQPSPRSRPHEPRAKNAPVSAVETPAERAAPPGLPLIDIDIPFSAEFDLAPLAHALSKPPESDGGWYTLRERFAHLGLAQGFDELLCLSHLRDVQTFWYQVETVRKVLKQFRGRVLLADEVGLGKTIEAGMVLKEYLLRGMVDSVLVLTPASLVGQWREELETKFEVPCATSHDSLLRTDPDRFWAQKRLIASIASARRSEHAARLTGRSFDLVIVDEAHHLRDRASQSLQAGGRAQQALPAALVRDAGAERPHRALQFAHAAQARHLQDAQGVSRRLHDARQAAPAGQSRAAPPADARRHGASLTGSCFSSESAPRPFHHGIRRRGGTI
jgi:SNF2-related domain